MSYILKINIKNEKRLYVRLLLVVTGVQSCKKDNSAHLPFTECDAPNEDNSAHLPLTECDAPTGYRWRPINHEKKTTLLIYL
jgi:hypothetical protein